MTNSSPSSIKYGLLLLDMGGPSSLEEIPDFLYRLFSDPCIIRLPGFFRKGLARLITLFRTRKTTGRYELIGGRSPIIEETNIQARELEKLVQVPVSFGMRYANPSIPTALTYLKEKGVNRLIVFPLFPQYSKLTTGSALKEFHENGSGHLPCRTIPCHYENPYFIAAHRERLLDILNKLHPESRAAILFVAHSVPLKWVKKGDPYVMQVKKTVSLILNKARINIPHYLAFQSRVGPVQWQGPSLEEALDWIKQKQLEQLVVHPLSFANENLETLYDLDIKFKYSSMSAGIKHFFRVPAPGIHPLYMGPRQCEKSFL